MAAAPFTAMCVMCPCSIKSIRCRFTPARRTWAPMHRILAAPVSFARRRRLATSGKSGCSNAGVSSESPSQCPISRSFTRSPRGLIWSLDRSKLLYFDRFTEQRPHQIRMTQIVGHDVVRAHTNQPLALPFVDHHAFGLSGRDAHRDAAHQLYFFDLDVAVAEAED